MRTAIDRLRPVALAGLGILIILALVNSIVPFATPLPHDDAYIFFRYADNMLEGHGLTWNAGGERVEGYSSFLYVMALAVPRALGANPLYAAHIINIGLFLGTLVLASWLVAIIEGRFCPVSLIGPALLATSAMFGELARMGMDAMLFAFVIVLALISYARLGADAPRFKFFVSGVAFGLVALTRPEGIAIYGVCFLFSVWDNFRAGRGWLGGGEWQRMAGVAAVTVPHMIWRIAYYGDYVPNTFHAKVGVSPEQILLGLGKGAEFLGTFRGATVSLALIVWALGPKTRMRNLLAALLVTWIGYSLMLGLTNWSLWYTMQIDLFALLTLGLGLGSILDRVLEGTAAPRLTAVVTTAAIAVLLVGNIDPTRFDARMTDRETMVRDFIVIGKALRQISTPGESLAVGACGAIPYFSGLEVYDTLGLNDKHIASQPGASAGWYAHRKGDGSYILGRQPTYMIPYPFLTVAPHTGHDGFEKSFIEIYEMPEFWAEYEYKNVQLADGRFFNYYQRKAGL